MLIPCDEELLNPLGLVTWAAIRLQHSVRDVIGLIEGELSDKPFEITLGQTIMKLEGLESKVDPESWRPIQDWCEEIGRPVTKDRNSILHAIAITSDGKQALKRQRKHGSKTFTADEITSIAHDLESANGKLQSVSKGMRLALKHEDN